MSEFHSGLVLGATVANVMWFAALAVTLWRKKPKKYNPLSDEGPCMNGRYNRG